METNAYGISRRARLFESCQFSPPIQHQSSFHEPAAPTFHGRPGHSILRSIRHAASFALHEGAQFCAGEKLPQGVHEFQAPQHPRTPPPTRPDLRTDCRQDGQRSPLLRVLGSRHWRLPYTFVHDGGQLQRLQHLAAALQATAASCPCLTPCRRSAVLASARQKLWWSPWRTSTLDSKSISCTVRKY